MAALPLLAQVGFLMKVVMVIWVIVSVALVLVVLIQKGRGGGLSGALGGGMASNILGSKTGDFLTWFTITLVGIFLLLSVLLAKFYKPKVTDFGQEAQVQTEMPEGDFDMEMPAMPETTEADAEEAVTIPTDVEVPAEAVEVEKEIPVEAEPESK